MFRYTLSRTSDITAGSMLLYLDSLIALRGQIHRADPNQDLTDLEMAAILLTNTENTYFRDLINEDSTQTFEECNIRWREIIRNDPGKDQHTSPVEIQDPRLHGRKPVANAIITNMDCNYPLDACVNSALGSDTEQHCFNCWKAGHTSTQCQDELCGYCQTSTPFGSPGHHTSANCPVRAKALALKKNSDYASYQLNRNKPGGGPGRGGGGGAGNGSNGPPRQSNRPVNRPVTERPTKPVTRRTNRITARKRRPIGHYADHQDFAACIRGSPQSRPPIHPRPRAEPLPIPTIATMLPPYPTVSVPDSDTCSPLDSQAEKRDLSQVMHKIIAACKENMLL
jgi:hypothetical protein